MEICIPVSIWTLKCINIHFRGNVISATERIKCVGGIAANSLKYHIPSKQTIFQQKPEALSNNKFITT